MYNPAIHAATNKQYRWLINPMPFSVKKRSRLSLLRQKKEANPRKLKLASQPIGSSECDKKGPCSEKSGSACHNCESCVSCVHTNNTIRFGSAHMRWKKKCKKTDDTIQIQNRKRNAHVMSKAHAWAKGRHTQMQIQWLPARTKQINATCTHILGGFILLPLSLCLYKICKAKSEKPLVLVLFTLYTLTLYSLLFLRSLPLSQKSLFASLTLSHSALSLSTSSLPCPHMLSAYLILMSFLFVFLMSFLSYCSAAHTLTPRNATAFIRRAWR